MVAEALLSLKGGAQGDASTGPRSA
jgi:hypothetical protein